MLFVAALAAGCTDPEKVFTVVFDSNGGSEVATQIVKAYGKATEPKPAPVLEGYEFFGWYTDKQTFTNRWNFETNAVTANITLHANWKEIKFYTVTFISNGGSKVPIQTVQADCKATVPKPVPTHGEGYVFTGWYTHNHTYNTGYNIIWNFEENAVTADTTLYAKWKTAEQFDIEECDKSLFKKWNGDPDITYSYYGSNPIEALWDGKLNTFFSQQKVAFTFDFGKIYTLTHFRLWYCPVRSYIFSYLSPKRFCIYGSTHPNARKEYDHSEYPAHQHQKWIFLGEFDTVKPSGLPDGQYSEDDWKSAHIDGIEYVFPVELAVPIRYFRMDILETWSIFEFIIIAEITFYGKFVEIN